MPNLLRRFLCAITMHQHEYHRLAYAGEGKQRVVTKCVFCGAEDQATEIIDLKLERRKR
jgi:hypothetical protein